jgi:hypothetical protein
MLPYIPKTPFTTLLIQWHAGLNAVAHVLPWGTLKAGQHAFFKADNYFQGSLYGGGWGSFVSKCKDAEF